MVGRFRQFWPSCQLPQEDGDYPLKLLLVVKKALFRCMEDPELEDARAILRAIDKECQRAVTDHITEEKMIAQMEPPADLPNPSEIIAAAVAAECERCAKIADEFVERTNVDIAHAIANAIRAGIE